MARIYLLPADFVRWPFGQMAAEASQQRHEGHKEHKHRKVPGTNRNSGDGRLRRSAWRLPSRPEPSVFSVLTGLKILSLRAVEIASALSLRSGCLAMTPQSSI